MWGKGSHCVSNHHYMKILITELHAPQADSSLRLYKTFTLLLLLLPMSLSKQRFKSRLQGKTPKALLWYTGSTLDLAQARLGSRGRGSGRLPSERTELGALSHPRTLRSGWELKANA